MAANDVTLSIPHGLPHQLVYRLQVERASPLTAPHGCRFELLSGLADALRHAGVLRRAFGVVGGAKTCIKIMTSARALYVVASGSGILSSGWMTMSRCRHYPVGPGEAVIGPIWTDPAHRGRGLATFGLKSCINRMSEAGCEVFFVDTAGDNLAMQKVLSKCGFGEPVACCLRNPRTGDLAG